MTRAIGAVRAQQAQAFDEWVEEHKSEMLAFPGADVVPACLIPAPPLIDTKALRTEAEQAFFVHTQLVAAGNAHRCHYRGFRTLVQLAASEQFPDYMLVVPHFVELRIAPIAWFYWSMREWDAARSPSKSRWNETEDEYTARKKEARKRPSQAPVRWLLSEQRFDTKSAWFDWSKVAFAASRSIVAPEHSILVARWNRMHAAMRAAYARGEDPLAAGERVFPRRAYEQLVRQARLQNETKAVELAGAVARGQWVWT